MADLRGFTAMSNQQGLTNVIEPLDAWFECVAAAVETHGGEILKFMGDGLLAIFRSEGDSADSCRRAAAAALEAYRGVDALNAGPASAAGGIVEFVVGGCTSVRSAMETSAGVGGSISQCSALP